jgi:hypothetical protein
MSADWLATVIEWARDIIGTVVILGGLALALRVLWLSWVTGNRQISDRFGVERRADEQHPVDRAAADPKPIIETPMRAPEVGKGMYG